MPLTEKPGKKYKKQPFCEISKKNTEELSSLRNIAHS